jgi:hypothetical protein
VYEEKLAVNPYDYDTRFDQAKMEESVASSSGNSDKVHAVYEAALKCVPPVKQKMYWRRYGERKQ